MNSSTLVLTDASSTTQRPSRVTAFFKKGYDFAVNTVPMMALLFAVQLTQKVFGADSLNTINDHTQYTLTNDTSAAKPITQDIVHSAASVSVLIWGPVLAAVVGGIVIWIMVAVNQGGVRGAINGIMALVIGGLAIALVYTYMIAKATTGTV